MTFNKPRQKAGIELKDIGGEVILYNPSNEQVHILNATAQVVWEFCDGGHTPDAIAGALTDRFEIPAGHDVPADVRRILSILSDKGLLDEAG